VWTPGTRVRLPATGFVRPARALTRVVPVLTRGPRYCPESTADATERIQVDRVTA
jgi:hypothetical protein